MYSVSIELYKHEWKFRRTRNAHLVPRAFSSTIFKMADRREKTLADSRNHVTDFSTEGGNLFKMAAKIKSERIWVRGLVTGEKQTKWRQGKLLSLRCAFK